MDEPWKQLKLSLERPYKDDEGNRILPLLDVTPQGEQIYDPIPDPNKLLSENIRKIFLERGHDFFDKRISLDEGDKETQDIQEDAESINDEDTPAATQPMTPEELFKMRMEIIPRLDIALGEMSEARNLLLLLLSATTPNDPPPIPNLPASALTATNVTKPPAIPSVQSFDGQLVVGGKDEALRKASSLFKSAAESMEATRVHGEHYWANALKIRRQTWGLLPAPLPFGSATGKGSDQTSKDFLVSFGMEESPASFRRRAIGHMATYGANTTSALVFPHRANTRLRVTLQKQDDSGLTLTYHSRMQMEDESTLEGSLKAAQLEVVEQELFSMLVREASNLPTASARVSERLIVIEAAQHTELTFELVDNNLVPLAQETDDFDGAVCNLIYAVLHVLLIRSHAHEKHQRLSTSEVTRNAARTNPPKAPVILQPIIDLIQYQVFCERVKVEMNKILNALTSAGIPARIRYNAVGECGEEVVRLISEQTKQKIGGDAILRIDERQSLRFTFLSPSTLTAHLAQATLGIASIPQLSQLLVDEVERFILTRICEIGTDACETVNGTWFLDLITNRSVGRWDGYVLDFRIFFTASDRFRCRACTLDGAGKPTKVLDTYESSKNTTEIFAWVQKTIEVALKK